MIGTRERQVSTVGAGKIFTLSEGDVNNLRTQMAETMADVLASNTQACQELLTHLRGPKAKRVRVDAFHSTATPDFPAGTAAKLTFPQTWLPSVAVISSIIYSVGGSANATLQIGKRIYVIQVAASIATPGSLPLAPDSGLVVYPNDLVQLTVPSTPVVMSLELIGFAIDPGEAERIIT